MSSVPFVVVVVLVKLSSANQEGEYSAPTKPYDNVCDYTAMAKNFTHSYTTRILSKELCNKVRIKNIFIQISIYLTKCKLFVPFSYFFDMKFY